MLTRGTSKRIGIKKFTTISRHWERGSKSASLLKVYILLLKRLTRFVLLEDLPVHRAYNYLVGIQ